MRRRRSLQLLKNLGAVSRQVETFLGLIKRIVNSLVSRFSGHLIDECLICSAFVMVKHGDQQYQFGMGGGQFRQDQTDV
jgi:hypothetical protein